MRPFPTWKNRSMPQDDFLGLPPELLERLHLVPELPLNYLKRTSELDALKKLVLAGKDSSVVIAGKSQPVTSRIGLYGMGGIGKSVLAAAVVRERDLLEHFPDGHPLVELRATA
ncbi:MAG: hypothetical protein HY774_14505 [Acidobacteria bacterium]|nr:hypothetical protein [Acidobacteriota bacterium]